MGNLLSMDSPLWRLADKALNLLWLNLLWLLCCIPIITIGASTSALYSVTLKYSRDQEGYLTKEFFHAFKSNFKQSTFVWLIMTAVGLILSLDLIMYLRSSSLSPFHLIMMTAFFTCILLYIFTCLYVYAYIANFRNTLRNCIQNALLLSIYHWPRSILMIVLIIGILCIGVFAFPPLLLCGGSLFCYISSRMLNPVFSNILQTNQKNLFISAE